MTSSDELIRDLHAQSLRIEDLERELEVSEECVRASNEAIVHNAEGGARLVRQLRSRIQELESIAANFKKHMESYSDVNANLNATVDRLKEELRSHKKEVSNGEEPLDTRRADPPASRSALLH